MNGVDSWTVKGDVNITFEAFILLILWYAVFPGCVGFNQRQIEIFNAFQVVHFAPVGFEIELVEIYGECFNIAK